MARGRDLGKEWFWRRLLAAWKASGQSVRAYCNLHDVAEESFYAWRRELARRDACRPGSEQSSSSVSLPGRQGQQRNTTRRLPQQPLFVPIDLEALRQSAALEVMLPSGRSIRVPVGFDAATLQQVVAALEERPC